MKKYYDFSPMKNPDLSGLFLVALPSIIGLWWLLAPRSVIRFYAGQSRQIGLNLHQPRPIFVRAAGLIWLAVPLVLAFLG